MKFNIPLKSFNVILQQDVTAYSTKSRLAKDKDLDKIKGKNKYSSTEATLP